MRISGLIKKLQAVMDELGDMPVFTYDGEINVVKATACRDGVSSSIDGVGQDPNEIVLEMYE